MVTHISFRLDSYSFIKTKTTTSVFFILLTIATSETTVNSHNNHAY